MRLVSGNDNVPKRERGSGDLLSLGWAGLGKLVQIESFALMGMHFEEMAIANPDTHSDPELDTGDAIGRGDAA